MSNRTLSAINDAIGPNGAQTLIRECGGTRVFVPRRMHPRHRLAHLLGLQVATRLVDRLGGVTLAIPRKSTLQRNKRDAEIIRLYDEGLSVKELARRFELTDRRIYAILSTPQEPEVGHG
ncbi:Mor transcription activator family protein [Magnetofaba australis]|uniref:Mor transcription activator family protein n=1 Tax=Magnetofaba australis TaxID=1472297 RepID=UPI000A19BCA7|nr:Mor transcription activator family protein [Magnetofaba australis]